MWFPRCSQRFCSCCRLQDRPPGAAALHGGLGQVDLPGPGSPGGPGAQPVLRPAHHRVHQAVPVSPRSQRVHWTLRGAPAAGDRRRRRAARAAGVLFPGGRSAQARHLPPVQPADWWSLEQTHDGLQIRAAGKQERRSEPGSERAAGWVDPLQLWYTQVLNGWFSTVLSKTIMHN